jgi:hypothetical protein
MIKDIKELFEIIPHYPGLNICLVDGFEVKEPFIKYCIDNEATLYLKDLNNSIDKDFENDFIKVERFDFNDKRYNLHSVLYDFVYLCCDIDDALLPEILKKFYRVIKNAGYIYLFSKDADSLITLLEETNFVSVNVIDNYKDTKVISAQKMHGWMKV